MAFILLTGFIALEPIGAWALRSAKIAGHYVGVYPIYYPENNSQFRPTHQAIWGFQKAYGTGGRDFHELMVPLWAATIKGDSADKYIDSIIMACPAFVQQTIGAERLRRSYTLYSMSIVYQRDHYPRGSAMPDTIPALEQQVIKDFQTYTSEINSCHWVWCHVAVPLRLFKILSFHSNLSLYMFQHTWRGRWWMEGIRGLFLLLHFLCCLSFIAISFLSKDKLITLLCGIIPAVYFFYLCYLFRGLEERYTLPILPLLLSGSAYAVYLLLNSRKGSAGRPNN